MDSASDVYLALLCHTQATLVPTVTKQDHSPSPEWGRDGVRDLLERDASEARLDAYLLQKTEITRPFEKSSYCNPEGEHLLTIISARVKSLSQTRLSLVGEFRLMIPGLHLCVKTQTKR